MATLSPGNTPCGIEMYNILDVELTSLDAFIDSIKRFQGINQADITKRGIIILHKFLMTIVGSGANLSIERRAFFETNQFIETVEKEIMNLAVISAPESLAEFKTGHGESFKSSISIFMDAVFHKEGGLSWRKEVFNQNLIETGTLCKNVQPVGLADIDISIDYKNPTNIAANLGNYVNGLQPAIGPGARQDNPAGSQLFNYDFTPGKLGFNIQGTCYLCGTAIGPRGQGSFDVANCEHVMPILSALHASDFFFSKNEVIPKLTAIKTAISRGDTLTPEYLAYIDKLLKISPEFAWSHKCCNMLKDNIEFLYLNNNGIYVPEYDNINKFLKWLFGPKNKDGYDGRDSFNQYDCDTVFNNALRASGGNIDRAKNAAYDSLISRVKVLCAKLNADNKLPKNDNINKATIIKLYGMFLLFKNLTLITVKNIVTRSTVLSNSRRFGGGSIITNTNYKNSKKYKKSKKSKKSKSLDIGKNIKMPMVGGDQIHQYIDSLSMDENPQVNVGRKQYLYNFAQHLHADSILKVDLIKNILLLGIIETQVSIVYNLALQLGATQPATIQIILVCLSTVKNIQNAFEVIYEEIRPCYIQNFANLICKGTLPLPGITHVIIIQLFTNLNDQLVYDMRVSHAFNAIIDLLKRRSIGLEQVFDIDDTIGYLASRDLSEEDICQVYIQLLQPLEIRNPNSAEIVFKYYLKNGNQKDATIIFFDKTIIGEDIHDENVKNDTYKKIKLNDAVLIKQIVNDLEINLTDGLIANIEQDGIGSDIVTGLLNLLFESFCRFLLLPYPNPNLYLRDILYDFISLYLKKKIVDRKILKVNPTDEVSKEILYMYKETSATLGILLSSLLSVNKAIKVNNSEFTQILRGNYSHYNAEILQASLPQVEALKQQAINAAQIEINQLKSSTSQQGISGPVTFTHPYSQLPEHAYHQGQQYDPMPYVLPQVSVNRHDGDIMDGGKLIRKRKTTRRNGVVIKRKKHNKSRKHKTRKHKRL